MDNNIFTLADACKVAGPATFFSMVKPIGSACNLDCKYCYYLDKANLYGGIQPAISDDLLETYIRQYIEANEVDTVTFCWHGGEPTLMGKEFFRKAIRLQEKYASGKTVVNSLQTNGTLLDKEWCDFFADNSFLVGISLDGPQDIHDAFRNTKGRAPTFDLVMKAVSLLHSCGVDFNTLSVVSSKSEGHGARIYRFLKEEAGSRFMQFLPAAGHVPTEWSVSSEGYGRFLCDIFDIWINNDVGNVFVQLFDATLANYAGVTPGVCTLAETCGDQLVVEHNGDVYVCDHFVSPDYLLGNIREHSLTEIYNMRKRKDFGLAKRNSLPGDCFRCRFWHLCHGECPEHRFDKNSEGFEKSILCEGLKMFFSHSEPAFLSMKEMLKTI